MEMYVGTIVLFGGDYEPESFLRCDGRELTAQSHGLLYTVIGNRFGGTPGRTFRLPDISAPDSSCEYYICTKGMYPSRP